MPKAKRSSPPLVSIVVLNWNHLEDTRLCLQHLKKLTYKNYEIILVDNGSIDGSKEYFAKQKGFIYVDNPTNRGFTGGHIDGLQKVSGEFILLLNNDAVTHPAVIERALRHFEDPKVGAVGGRAYFWNKDNPLLAESNKFYSYQQINPFSAEALTLQYDQGVAQIVNNVSGSCVMVRKSLIDKLGYLYDPFFAYYEECDLFARFKRAGYKILYDPEVRIWHKVAATSNDHPANFFFYRMFRNRFTFALRNFESDFLGAFLRSYVKISINALLRVWRPDANQGMHQAYVRAAWSSLLHLGQALAGRRTLHRQLGKSNYNHLLIGEQNPISFVLDCTAVANTSSIVKKLLNSKKAHHEYIFVVKSQALQTQLQKLMVSDAQSRIVLDRGYFKDAHSLTLGAVAATYDWLYLNELTEDFDSDRIETLTAQLQRQQKEVGIWSPTATHKPIDTMLTQPIAQGVLMHRAAFLRGRGLDKAYPIGEAMRALLMYLAFEKLETFITVPTDRRTSVALLPILRMTDNVRHEFLLSLRSRLAEQQHLSRRITWFDKLNARYYRLLQLTNTIKWLANPHIRMRQKLGRSKNVLLFMATLRRKQLATELKHIQNELLLSRGPINTPHTQTEKIAKRLDQVVKKPADIPVFIICRDRVSGLKELVPWLEKHQLKKIVFIDNASEYDKLTDYFDKTPYQVLKMNRNIGHRVPWIGGLVPLLVPHDFYIVTDPDVIPTEYCPDDAIKYFLQVHKDFPHHWKVGFGLKIDDLPNHYALKKKVVDWEGQFWKYEIAPGLYEASVDTTFALYKPYTYTYTLHPSIRTGEPYVARHIAWYVDSKSLTEEDIFYRLHADQEVTTWDKDQLSERYEKELRKKK
jgi:GT2 family glycosyltransferase